MSLSKTELEILQWLADGKQQNDIAIIRQRSERAVKCLVRSAKDKLQAETTTHAVVIAIRQGIID